MDSSTRAVAQISMLKNIHDTGYFSHMVAEITGSLRAAQVYHALLNELDYLIQHDQELDDGWFYWEGKYAQRVCRISLNHLAHYTNILIDHGLLERKSVNLGGRKGKLNYYRIPDITLQQYVGEFAIPRIGSANQVAIPRIGSANLPDDLTGNSDTPLIDENSSRARTLNKNIKNKNHMDAQAHPTKPLPPKNSKSGGVLLTVPNYSKNDMKCAQFCFETICKNFPKSNAAKAGWDSLRDEWSATIDKLAKKFTEGDDKRVQAALQWAFGPRNRRNSFLQENIRSLPMLLTKKWKTSDEMEFTFDRLLREFDVDTKIDTEDSLDAKLRTACEKALAEYEQPDYSADDVMEWVEYLQDEIDRLNKLLPPDKRGMWHRRESMAKVIPWITELLECFVGCSMYPNVDKYVDRFLEITENKIRSGKLKYLWPGYFSFEGDDYAAFEQHITDLYPNIFN